MADTPAPATENSCRTVLVIDGAYAHIGARNMPGGRIDYVKFREVLERQAVCRFRECWFFDQEPIRHKSATQGLSAQYTALKLAPPQGPQFQLKLYAMKKYACHCRRCGHQFTQNVQKGVDNGIATKILSLAYENVCDRFILFAGDGDFYDSLNLIKNVLRKDLWVIGFRDTVSADLQQLASHVIWLNDVWPSVQVNTPVPQPTQVTQPQHNQTGQSQQPPSQAPLVPPPPPVSRTHSATSTSGSQLPPYPPVVDTTDKDEDMLASTANPRRRRRGNTERQIEVTSDSGSRGGRGKGRDRRRNGGRNGGPVLQPPANEAEAESEREADEAWFFFDKSGMGHEAAVLPAAASTTSEKKNADEERGNGKTGNGKKRFERSPPKRKRRRQDPQPLTFELSDMSSEEDEQPPGLSNHQPVGSPPPATTSNQDNVMIIDLASDSDSS